MVKRAREEGDAGQLELAAAKRQHQQQAQCWHPQAAPAAAQMEAEMVADDQQQQAAQQQQQQQQQQQLLLLQKQQQHPAADSTCTDIVLYRPTRLDGRLQPADASALLAQLAGGSDAAAQLLPTGSNDTAQLKSLWRSLSSSQRRSLAGMWEQLRDGRGMLAALPGICVQQHDGVLNGFAPRRTCVIEELDDDDTQHSAQQQQQAAAPAGDSAMALDAAPEQQQQQQQQQPAAVWAGQLHPVGSAPMDMEMEG